MSRITGLALAAPVAFGLACTGQGTHDDAVTVPVLADESATADAAVDLVDRTAALAGADAAEPFADIACP